MLASPEIESGHSWLSASLVVLNRAFAAIGVHNITV